jgi:ABC-type multidrug transport system fused ATPase/permease subunit
VLSVVIALITGFIGLIAALPNVQAIASAKIQGKLIFDVIDRTPLIRDFEVPESSKAMKGLTVFNEAETELQLSHSIRFENVTFKYPTALPEHNPTLQNATFSIPAG